MSKAEESALKAYPKPFLERITTDVYAEPREFFQEGYEQAKKDTIERACDMLMNYVFEEVTPEMRDHFRKAMEEE